MRLALLLLCSACTRDVVQPADGGARVKAIAIKRGITLVSLVWMYWTEIVPQRQRAAAPQGA